MTTSTCLPCPPTSTTNFYVNTEIRTTPESKPVYGYREDFDYFFVYGCGVIGAIVLAETVLLVFCSKKMLEMKYNMNAMRVVTLRASEKIVENAYESIPYVDYSSKVFKFLNFLIYHVLKHIQIFVIRFFSPPQAKCLVGWQN